MVLCDGHNRRGGANKGHEFGPQKAVFAKDTYRVRLCIMIIQHTFGLPILDEGDNRAERLDL